MTATPNPFLTEEQEARLDRLEAIQAEKAKLAAEEFLILHALSLDPPEVEVTPSRAREDKRWVKEQVACSLRIAPSTALGRLVTAEHLVTQLPGTLALLAAGSISLAHVLRICEATYPMEPETCARLEAVVLPDAADQSASQFRQSVRVAAARLDTRTAKTRHEAAVAERGVYFQPNDHGVCDLIAANLPADAAAAIRDTVHHLAALAKGCDQDGEPRTADQRRADTLIDLIMTGAGVPTTAANSAARTDTATAAGTGQLGAVEPVAVAPTVHVTVALSTLLGLDEHGGELAGHGPIPAALARALAFDPTGTWRRLVTDERGHLLDVGARTYRPGAALDRHVRRRDRTCRFPGCRRPAERGEVDHIRAWADGGLTTEANTHCLCSRHHHLKHETRWRVQRNPDGSTTWTNPTGRKYRQPPPDPLPVDTTLVIPETEEPAPF